MYYPSSGGIALIKQQQPFKLFEKYKTVVSASMVNEILIGAHGDASVGLWSAQSYFWNMPGERNAAFVKAFEERYKRKPTYIDADAYLSFDLVHQAILKARTTDVPAVRTALAGLETSTMGGRCRDACGRSPVAAPARGGAGRQGRRGQGRDHDEVDHADRQDRAGRQPRMQDVSGARRRHAWDR